MENQCLSGAVVDFNTYMEKAKAATASQTENPNAVVKKLKAEVKVLKEANLRMGRELERVRLATEQDARERAQVLQADVQAELEELRSANAVLEDHVKTYLQDLVGERAVRIDAENRVQALRERLDAKESTLRRSAAMLKAISDQLTFNKNAVQTFLRTDLQAFNGPIPRPRASPSAIPRHDDDIEEDGDGGHEQQQQHQRQQQLLPKKGVTCHKCKGYFQDSVLALSHDCP